MDITWIVGALEYVQIQHNQIFLEVDIMLKVVSHTIPTSIVVCENQVVGMACGWEDTQLYLRYQARIVGAYEQLP